MKSPTLTRGAYVVVCLAGMLLGCGQKGPLVLPDAPKHKRTMPKNPATSAPAAGSATAGPAPAPASPTTPTPAPTNTPATPSP